MTNVIASVSINAGATVGLFAAAGATIAASTTELSLPSDGSNLVMVNSSGGAGAVFLVRSSFSVGASEVYIKNISTINTTIYMRIFDNA